jgi:hypothetical protein
MNMMSVAASNDQTFTATTGTGGVVAFGATIGTVDEVSTDTPIRSYEITGGANQADFAINNSGLITVARVGGIPAGTYVIEVTEVDAEWEDEEIEVTITVSDPPTNPIGTITGTTTLTDVPLNVVLPLNLNFAIDRFEFGGNGQINSAGYSMVNRTGIAVEVAFLLTATLGTGVTTRADSTVAAGTFNPDDRSLNTKVLYLSALSAASVDNTDPVLAFDTPRGGTYTYTAATTAAHAGFAADTATPVVSNIAFVLGAATDGGTSGGPINTLAATNAGVAAFRFHGVLNTYASWAANDITITGAYTITPLTPDTYTTMAAPGATGTVADTLNMLTPAP